MSSKTNYRKVRKGKEEVPKNEVRITKRSALRNYVAYALSLFREHGY